MAKFSKTFLQGLLTPTYQQTLTEAARGAAMTPALIFNEQERKRREKGMMGGMLAAQQAASTARVLAGSPGESVDSPGLAPHQEVGELVQVTGDS